MFGITKRDKLKRAKKSLFKVIKAKHCFCCRLVRGSDECKFLCGSLMLDYRKVDAELYERSPE